MMMDQLFLIHAPSVARREGLAPLASARSAAFKSLYIPRRPNQRSGSGSHLRKGRLTQGRQVSAVVLSKARSAKVRPARFEVETPTPT